MLAPGFAARSTVAGATPGAAHAGAATAVTSAVTAATVTALPLRPRNVAVKPIVTPSAPPRLMGAASARRR
ncbi:hypothetical protein GCM10023176_17210 [Micromonospora coerulea]|uniref:Uncharacterized protein n=1 Tax=Micromonospora coerulea TaxID=47856 RepID=A0ABP8SEB3_9ACTN